MNSRQYKLASLTSHGFVDDRDVNKYISIYFVVNPSDFSGL